MVAPGDREAMADHFEQSTLILAVVQGEGLRIVAANGTLLGMFPHRQLVDTPVADVFGELGGRQVLDVFEECYRTGRPGEAREWRLVTTTGDGGEAVLYVDFRYEPWHGADGTVKGVLVTAADVTQTVERRLRAEQAQDLAERRYADAQAVVRTMQAALLPDTVPVVPGLDLAAHYLVAAEDTDAGGDWFDVFDRADGDVLLVVGHVVGVALQELDRFAGTVEGATSATVCVVRMAAGASLVEYCTAGHPPPLVVAPDGDARYLATTGAGPLGTGRGFATSTATLAVGDVVVLHSDGLVERPGRTPAQNTVELLEVCRDVVLDRGVPDEGTPRPAERLCQQAVEHLVRRTGHADDITIVAAQRTREPEPLRLEVPADPASVPAVRRVLATWVDAFDPREADAAALQLAVNELVANAVVHGYSRDGTGTVGVSARVDHGGVVHAEVVDQGGWVDHAEDPGDGSEPSEGGRGLVLVQAVTNDFVLEHAERGTAARFSMQLRRSVELVDTGRWSVPSPRRRSSDRFEVEVRDDVVVLRGAIDLVSAPRMEAVLREESLGGCPHTVVDLDGVTLLTSSAVSVLDRAARSGRVRLQASPGTPAQHVLDLVALPHDTPAGDGRTGV